MAATAAPVGGTMTALGVGLPMVLVMPYQRLSTARISAGSGTMATGTRTDMRTTMASPQRSQTACSAWRQLQQQRLQPQTGASLRPSILQYGSTHGRAQYRYSRGKCAWHDLLRQKAAVQP